MFCSKKHQIIAFEKETHAFAPASSSEGLYIKKEK